MSPKDRALAFANGMFSGHSDLYLEELIAAFEAVAQEEREACAKIAEDYGGYQGEGSQIAAEIRARKA